MEWGEPISHQSVKARFALMRPAVLSWRGGFWLNHQLLQNKPQTFTDTSIGVGKRMTIWGGGRLKDDWRMEVSRGWLYCLNRKYQDFQNHFLWMRNICWLNEFAHFFQALCQYGFGQEFPKFSASISQNRGAWECRLPAVGIYYKPIQSSLTVRKRSNIFNLDAWS